LGDDGPIAFLRGGAGELASALAPSPAWDPGLVGVNARARHWMGCYGLSAARRIVFSNAFEVGLRRS